MVDLFSHLVCLPPPHHTQALEPHILLKASYYEKWALAIAALLLEKQKITLKQLDAQLFGDSDRTVVPTAVSVPFTNGWTLSHSSLLSNHQ